MYKSYYSKTCFSDKNKWYYKILKKEVDIFLRPYRDFRNGMEESKILAISQQMEKYCKPEKPPINIKLRNDSEIEQCDNELIYTLDCLINQFRIPENIIVYRGSDIDVFTNKKTVYEDLGYFSTSLVQEAVFFAHNKRYLYKILISKGVCGFCPQVFTCRDIEYELILSRNTKIQLIKKKRRETYTEIICKMINKI